MKKALFGLLLVISCLFAANSQAQDTFGALVPDWSSALIVTPPGETQVFIIPWAVLKAESGEWSFNRNTTTVTVQKKGGEPVTGEIERVPLCRFQYAIWNDDYNSTQSSGILQRAMCTGYPPPGTAIIVRPVLCRPKADGTPVALPCAYKDYLR